MGIHALSHEVKYPQGGGVVIRFTAGAQEGRQNVLIGLHPAHLHILQKQLGLVQRTDLRTARHQRRVCVLA